MKTINAFIIEKLKVSKNTDNGPTVADFILSYYDLSGISEFTFDEFEMTDFDPESLDDHFDGDMKSQYEYIVEHFDDPIGKITVTNPYGDFEHEFLIGNIKFKTVCTEEFPRKNY